MKTIKLFTIILGVFLLNSPAMAAWTFGVISDTQGAGHSDVRPNGVSVRLMAPVVDRMVDTHQIDMMISLGDLTAGGNSNEFDQWLAIAAPLYDAGIDVYPIRGNHDDGAEADVLVEDPLYGPVEVKATDIWLSKFPHLDPAGDQLDSRVEPGPGASYAFTYNSVRFVALDVYGAAPSYLIGWLQQQTRGDAEHMFIYAHEPFFGRGREGVLGDDPIRIQLLAGMAANGAEIYFSGHDHQYSRSAAILDGAFLMQHIIGGSNAEKYYRFENEINVGEEVGFKQLNDVLSYSIVHIDGPFVTFEHYASEHPDPQDPSEMWDPNWVLVDSVTYSTEGSQHAVEAGGSLAALGSYADPADGFIGTGATILNGYNNSFEQIWTNPDTGVEPKLSQYGNLVSFAWKSSDVYSTEATAIVSDVLMLDGLTDTPQDAQTDVYVLEMQYTNGQAGSADETQLMLSTLVDGQWLNAVEGNVGGFETFVLGPWQSTYGLGTYGVDPDTDTVWAVLNHQGYFAVTVFTGM